MHGTTGYEFAAVVNNLFVDRRNERALDDIYRRVRRASAANGCRSRDLAYRSKKQVLHETMSGDINSLGHQLNRFSERNRHFRDFTLYSLISTLKEVIACFPVYRTYVTGGPSRSASTIAATSSRRCSCAKRRAPAVTALVFDFIERLLLKQTRDRRRREECEERARFIGKFQQITSPVAAKGIEDTALYIYNRLLSLNEVGADPTQFGLEPAAVHDWMAERQRRWPRALSATSTHDTKRGEDVRARLNVLSEIPGRVEGGGDEVARRRTAASRPRSSGALGARTRTRSTCSTRRSSARGRSSRRQRRDGVFRDRIDAYMTKALREAKVHTSWLSPDEEYEAAVERFVDARFSIGGGRTLFLQSFEPFAGARRGARHLQQPRAAADQDHRAGRAGLLSGHRAVGSQSRRSGQPPAGGLRRSRRAGARVAGARGAAHAARALLDAARPTGASRCSSSIRALAARGAAGATSTSRATTCR